MKVEMVEGDLLDQPVEVIVNAWNRNVLPWWLLIPQGISRAIKKRAGLAPFRELAALPMLKLGDAVLTSAGALPYRGIIHVAGIDLWWRATEKSVARSTQSALQLMSANGFQSIAFPLIGAGTGALNADQSAAIIAKLAQHWNHSGIAYVVRYKTH
jgi:O-acetyl-ADP-ribose deacetylase